MRAAHFSFEGAPLSDLQFRLFTPILIDGGHFCWSRSCGCRPYLIVTSKQAFTGVGIGCLVAALIVGLAMLPKGFSYTDFFSLRSIIAAALFAGAYVFHVPGRARWWAVGFACALCGVCALFERPKGEWATLHPIFLGLLLASAAASFWRAYDDDFE